MDSRRPDFGKHPWPISPTFRTGPRREDHDQDAEEIIRFVRKFQRPDTQQPGASSVTRKAVLPAIVGYHSCSDVTSPIYNAHQRLSNIESEVQQSVAEIQTTQTAVENLNNNAAQRFEKVFDSTGSVNGSSNNYLNDAYNNNNIDVVDTIESQEALENSNISRTHTRLNDLTENKSVIPDDQLPTSRSMNPCNNHDKLGLARSTTPAFSIHFSHSVTLQYCSKLPQTIGQLPRLRALPRLPPIATSGVPSRPLAPSPSQISPSHMFSSQTDDFSDDDKDSYESQM